MINLSWTNGKIQKKNTGHCINFLEIFNLVGDTIVYNNHFKYLLALAQITII